MMNLQSMKLSRKLTLMVAIPAVILIGFATVVEFESVTLRQDAVKLQSMADLSVKFSSLVHEMQKERGMTAGFIGSQGGRFGPELKNQREETNTRRQILDEFLTEFDAARLGEEFEQHLQDAIVRLDRMNEIRRQVDGLNIALGDALRYYTGNNAALLSMISEMSTLSPDKGLAIMTAAYANFLQGKERAGIERAVLANTFSRDQFTGGLFNRFMSLVTIQNTYRDVFLSLATEEHQQFYRDTLQGESVDEAERMRQVAIDNAASGGFGIDATYWFSMQTGKINLLKEIEDKLAEDLAAAAASLKGSATTALIVSFLTTLAGLAITVWMAIVISRSISRQIGGEPAEIESIAQGIADGDLGKGQMTAVSESTGIYASMQQLQGKLSEVIEKDIQAIVDAARDGDLSKRVPLENRTGFYEKLGQGINDLVDVNERVIGDTVRVFSALSHGNLNETINTDYRGSFDQLKHDANATVEKIRHVIEGDIQSLVDAARTGDLKRRIDISDKDGFFESLSLGMNELVGTVDQVFSDIAGTMRNVAEGDLTQTIDTDYQGAYDDLKQDINKTITNLDGIIADVRDSSKVINNAAAEISSGNENLSSRTEQQASSLEETASSMEELTSTVQNNATNALQANQLAQSARNQAEEGGAVVNQAIDAMSEISTSSNKIEEIIGVIDEIAFQTNLLALNASVEAARAGEQGRGFAVVATEVRNLAQRSATAAKEIKDLIQDSVSKVDAGSALVNQSGETLSEIVNSVKKVGDIISEITAASQEQSEGIEQVNQAVAGMDSITQQNAAIAEQTSAAAFSMNEKAQEMEGAMSFFTVSRTVSSANKPVASAAVLQTPVATVTEIDRSVESEPKAAEPRAVPKPVVVPIDDDDWEEF